MKLKIRVQRVLRSYGKDAFVEQLQPSVKLFDIGCGNNSPQRIKELRPDIYYVGLDVQDYVQSNISLNFADEYRIALPENFLDEILREHSTMDAVISSHNLEHCSDQFGVLQAMCRALKPGGKIYLAFPCEESVGFPSRAGTLRFSDDQSHTSPPDWHRVIDCLSQNNMKIIFSSKRYRPIIPLIIGAILEPYSFTFRKVIPLGASWALWGFESVVWAEKVS